jgi:hypothetical protein
MIVGALVLSVVTAGNTEASTTRVASRPLNRGGWDAFTAKHRCPTGRPPVVFRAAARQAPL